MSQDDLPAERRVSRHALQAARDLHSDGDGTAEALAAELSHIAERLETEITILRDVGAEGSAYAIEGPAVMRALVAVFRGVK